MKTKSSVVMFIASWLIAIGVRIGSQMEWQIIKDFLRACPPLQFGTWEVGLTAQIIITIALVARWHRTANIGVIFAVGYWSCAIVHMVAAYWFVARGMLVTGHN